MKRIYVAGPLFSDSERKFNAELNDLLIKKGYSTFLPQKDGMELARLLELGENESSAIKKIYTLDYSEIEKADILIFIVDGRVPDEGACVELGYAYALGKVCIGLKTDVRSLISGKDNPMIVGALNGRMARSQKELLDLLATI